MPRQMTAPHDERFIPKSTATGGAPADPLDHPDPLRAADSAGAENLLRCWVRETDPAGPDGPTLRIPLPASGTALLVPVLYWSATGWHRFGPPVLEGAPEGAPPADAVTIAALLGREAGRDEGADMVARVADSVRRTAGFIAERRRAPHAPAEADLFLTAEQSLLLGHPQHPTPKSREGLSDAESRLYSPESHGSFALNWMAVDRSVLATDSAWTDGGRPVPPRSWSPRTPGDCVSPTTPHRFRSTPGRPANSYTVPKSPRCSTPGSSTTWDRTANAGTPPLPFAPCTGPVPRSCSSSPSAFASPTPAGRTSARSSTAEWRSTGCSAAGSPPSGTPPVRASTSSATPPGWPSTARTAVPSRVSM